jgi:hypothetical protein
MNKKIHLNVKRLQLTLADVDCCLKLYHLNNIYKSKVSFFFSILILNLFSKKKKNIYFKFDYFM